MKLKTIKILQIMTIEANSVMVWNLSYWFVFDMFFLCGNLENYDSEINSRGYEPDWSWSVFQKFKNVVKKENKKIDLRNKVRKLENNYLSAY